MNTTNELPANVAHALRRVIDYLLADEAADYMATSPLEDRENHIYVSLRVVHRWLRAYERGARPALSGGENHETKNTQTV